MHNIMHCLGPSYLALPVGDLALPVGLLGQWLDVRLEEVDDIDLHHVLRRRELGEGLEAVVVVLKMRKRAVVT